jgi:zinc/manganese transport system substrate-binding protein
VVAASGPAAAQSPAATPSATLPTAVPVEAPRIAVTTSILAAVTRELVADRATVVTLMPDAADPHEWLPSPQDIEALTGADLVVANGLGLEEGLCDALAAVEAEGVPVFRATDHVTLRRAGPDGLADPHIWTDPLTMAQAVDALAGALAAVGLEVDDQRADLAARLASAEADARSLLDAVPAERRTLVTGHESLGYFADRFGFRMVGTVVPGLSSQGEATARELAELVEAIRAAGVPAIFAEAGTPRSVVDAIAAETGARVVELPIHALPADGSYLTWVHDLAATVADALR